MQTQRVHEFTKQARGSIAAAGYAPGVYQQTIVREGIGLVLCRKKGTEYSWISVANFLVNNMV
jgi:L-asparaginase II